jgi:dihydrofolate reductase
LAKTRVHNFVVSLDGFATGEGQSLAAGFGHAQQEFGDLFQKIGLWRGIQEYAPFGPNEAIAAAWGPGIGAEIMGRNKFHPTTGPLDSTEPGWWGDNPPFHTPCFIMTHYPRDPIVKEGGTTFYFVDAGPEKVLALAMEAANGLDVRIGGGPTTLNAFLKADLVDYMHLIIAPILLGRGVPLWTGLEGIHKRFAVTPVSLPSGVTHLFFERR